MMLGGLPGGSPGPNAIGTWGTLLAATLFALVAGAMLLWLLLSAVRQVEQGGAFG